MQIGPMREGQDCGKGEFYGWALPVTVVLKVHVWWRLLSC